MTPSLEGSPTNAKEAPYPKEVRLAPLDTNPVFQCLRKMLRGSLNNPIFMGEGSRKTNIYDGIP